MWKPDYRGGSVGPELWRMPAAGSLSWAMNNIEPRMSGLLRARRLLTMVPGLEGDALWWEDGRVQAVGRAAELERVVPRRIPRFDLPDTLVTPGLVDGHTHLASWALNRSRLELAGVRTREDVLARVAKAHLGLGWVLGQGWDANGWATAPDRWALDRVQPAPVYLDSHDMHAAWLNTAALAAAGITRHTRDPFGGRIVRDATGDPTGLLLERAVELATPHLPEPQRHVLDSALVEAQAEAHRLGITGIHDVENMATLAAFKRLESKEVLRMRVLFHPPVAALGSLIGEGVRSGHGSDWLAIGGVKMFLDGSLGSRTAWMLEPYAGTRDRGLPISTELEVRQAMHAAATAGIASTVHAIGDAAVRRALDLLSQLPAVGLPHRIEHFQCVHPLDLDRAPSSGLVLSMQPAHLLADIPLVERHWGDRGRGAYAFRSLQNRGARLVFGSDVPVASLDPREGIYAAMERIGSDGPAGGWHPDEKMDFCSVIRAYTAGAADAAGTGTRRGRLAPGYDADLVAWSVDPSVEFGNGAAIREARAMLTIVGGQVVMQQ
jgi:predicted amidohydrolase YtcJ